MIPVFEPVIGEDEIQAVVAALRRGEISGTFGKALNEFESEFAAYCGCKHGIAVSSGTTALHIAIDALKLPNGSEVLVSASTNIASALAIAHNGLIPVSVDSENITWNLDLDLIESLISEKTKAIMPVHLYGHPVEMGKLNALAKKHNLKVIEDCAESHGATCHGQMTGSFGDMGCFSFYANKVITTGEGGMIVTSDDKYAERLRSLRNLAFTQPRFKHIDMGYNFRMTGYQAAMGVVQIRKIEAIIADKRRVAGIYNKLLAEIEELQLPTELAWARNVYWMYGIVLKKSARVSRDVFVNNLLKLGVDTRTFFCPMNIQPCLQSIEGFKPQECPVAERLWENGLYLPSTHTLSEESLHVVVNAIKKALI